MAGNHPRRIAVFPGQFDPITNGHLDLIARECKIGRPIKAHGIDRDLFHIAHEPGSDTARESDHLGIRHLPAHLRDDALRGLQSGCGSTGSENTCHPRRR